MNRQHNAKPAHYTVNGSRAWVDTQTQAKRQCSLPRVASIRWAAKALQTNLGTAVAVRLDESGLAIGLRVAGRESLLWRHAAQVLTASQAERWATEGFAR